MEIIEPIVIGGVTFKNRIMFPPMTTGYEDKDGSISSQSCAFYTRLAEGGVGYIVLGDVAPIRTPKLKIASDLSSTILPTMLENYKAHGVEIYTAHTVTSIAEDELNCEDKERNTIKIQCDYVVIASCARPVIFDTTALNAQGIEIIKIGDCYEVADISQATKTGYDAANVL